MTASSQASSLQSISPDSPDDKCDRLRVPSIRKFGAGKRSGEAAPPRTASGRITEVPWPIIARGPSRKERPSASWRDHSPVRPLRVLHMASVLRDSLSRAGKRVAECVHHQSGSQNLPRGRRLPLHIRQGECRQIGSCCTGWIQADRSPGLTLWMTINASATPRA
jgi:hypothetical protein